MVSLFDVSRIAETIELIPTKGGTMADERPVCCECGQAVDETRIFEIDGVMFCAICLFGEVTPHEIFPIGTVENELQRPERGFGTTGPNRLSRIVLHPAQKRFMYKLEEEKYLTVVYYLHSARSVTSIFRRGLDGKETGLFATRTPDRLSKIGIQDVLLIKVEDTTLWVDGLDAVNGTPVLDIKLGRPIRGGHP